MRYKIEVHSEGYEDTAKIVDAPSMNQAKRLVRTAVLEWCEHNAIDLDGEWDFPFTRITKS